MVSSSVSLSVPSGVGGVGPAGVPVSLFFCLFVHSSFHFQFFFFFYVYSFDMPRGGLKYWP